MEENPGKEYENIDINSVDNEEARTAGAEYVVYEIIKELGIDKKLGELGLSRNDVAATDRAKDINWSLKKIKKTSGVYCLRTDRRVSKGAQIPIHASISFDKLRTGFSMNGFEIVLLKRTKLATY